MTLTSALIGALALSASPAIAAEPAPQSDLARLLGNPARQAQIARYQSALADPYLKGTAGANQPPAMPEAKVVLAISASVPLPTLRRYAAQLATLDGVMVIRGGVGGLERIAPTLQWIAQVLNVDPLCEGPDCQKHPTSVVIDPLVFRQWQIDRVPALVLVDRYTGEPYCEQSPSDARRIVYGDASLRSLLHALRSDPHEDVRRSAAQLLATLESEQ